MVRLAAGGAKGGRRHAVAGAERAVEDGKGVVADFESQARNRDVCARWIEQEGGHAFRPDRVEPGAEILRPFAQMNQAWDAWVVSGKTPARATVEAKLAAAGYDVEIMIEAAI